MLKDAIGATSLKAHSECLSDFSKEKISKENSKELFRTSFEQVKSDLQHIGHISHATAPDHHDHNDTIAD